MATRKQIRSAFYSELETAASSWVPADNISEESPNKPESYPAIRHRDRYRKVPINQASDAPTAVQRDASGDATAESYDTLHEAQFEVGISDSDESRREDIYEAVRSHFEKHDTSPKTWPPSNIQADVEWVRVTDSNSDDDTDRMPLVRGDRLTISLVFKRRKNNTDSAIQTVDTAVDADNDGTDDVTYTFSG